MSRSQQMARIRSGNTRPERLLRQAVWARGLRYRLGGHGLPGRPDIVFVGPRIAVFVDGCFWHGCPEHYTKPTANAHFWSEKLSRNLARDRRDDAALSEAGWIVLRFWEHQIKSDVTSVASSIQDRVLAAVSGRDGSAAGIRSEPS